MLRSVWFSVRKPSDSARVSCRKHDIIYGHFQRKHLSMISRLARALSRLH
jgi:hypothetical protein